MPRSSRTLDGVTYAPGARFRVAVPGVQLVGMVPAREYRSGAFRGWKQDLAVGDIVTCTGFGAGFGSDPGYGVEFTSEQSETEGAINCEIRPSVGGLWNYRPLAGVLTAEDA